MIERYLDTGCIARIYRTSPTICTQSQSSSTLNRRQVVAFCIVTPLADAQVVIVTGGGSGIGKGKAVNTLQN